MKLTINGYKVHRLNTAFIVVLTFLAVYNACIADWRDMFLSLAFLSYELQMANEESKVFNFQKKVDELEALSRNVQKV